MCRIQDATRITTPAQLDTFFQGPPGHYMVSITAGVADHILQQYNTPSEEEENRTLKQARCQPLVDDMGARPSRWRGGSQMCFGVFPDRIRVGDGQTRLTAQVRTGTEQVYVVEVIKDLEDFGLSVMTKDPFKSGRTLADLLTILNIVKAKHSTVAEQVLDAIMLFRGIAVPRAQSPQTRVALAREYARSLNYVVAQPRKLFNARLLAALAIAHHKHAARVEKIISNIKTNSALSGAELAFFKKLGDWKKAKAKDRDRTVGHALRIIFDAINQRGTVTTFSRDDTRSVIAHLLSHEIADEWFSRVAS